MDYSPRARKYLIPALRLSLHVTTWSVEDLFCITFWFISRLKWKTLRRRGSLCDRPDLHILIDTLWRISSHIIIVCWKLIIQFDAMIIDILK